jgi:epoxyqueuosine reductase QueG
LTEPRRAVVGIVGSASALTPTQRKFNQLIEQLTLQRQELARWQAFHQIYTQQLAEHYHPALARLRDKQVAMVRLMANCHLRSCSGR